MGTPFLLGEFKKSPTPNRGRIVVQISSFYNRIRGDNFYFSIRRRDSYPRTFALKLAHAYVSGYAEDSFLEKVCKSKSWHHLEILTQAAAQASQEEFLLIAIPKNRAGIHIFRDAFCTLPLFLLETPKAFWLSNRFSRLALEQRSNASIKLDFQGLIEQLVGLEAANRTLFFNIRRVPERSHIIISAKSQKLILPASPTAPILPGRQDSPELFKNQLIKTVGKYWQKTNKQAKIGFEMSGGIDSATCPLLLAKKTRHILEAFSIHLPDSAGKSQTEKYRIIENRYKIRIHKAPARGAYPLLSQAKKKHWTPFDPNREIYCEALQREVRLARQRGIDVIFTGMGGDELFQIDERELEGFQGQKEADFRKELSLPEFFTNFLRRKIVQYAPIDQEFPVPLVPYSVLAAHTARNNIFIENGIWPVAPLGDPWLARLGRSLSKKWRQDKRILRKFHREQGHPRQIINQEYNENFGSFFETSIKKPYFQKFMTELLQNSALQGLNFINTPILLAHYNHYRKNNDIHYPPIYFYAIVAIEINLQSMAT